MHHPELPHPASFVVGAAMAAVGFTGAIIKLCATKGSIFMAIAPTDFTAWSMAGLTIAYGTFQFYYWNKFQVALTAKKIRDLELRANELGFERGKIAAAASEQAQGVEDRAREGK